MHGLYFIVFAVLVAGVLIWFSAIKERVNPCPLDAMFCPNGSYVGRSGPNCEFKCPRTEVDGNLFKTTGTVIGRVSIGPLCPIEPCPGPTPDIFSSRQAVFTPKGGGRPVDLPFYAPLDKNGEFVVELPAGNYEITITNCDFLGCTAELPKTLTVSANKTSELNIMIDTGIR